MLPTIPLNELLALWAELVEAEHGVNSYGGDTAELYAYRFTGRSPCSELDHMKVTQLGRQSKMAMAASAGHALEWLLKSFASERDVRIEVDGVPLVRFHPGLFDHRVHVRVSKEDPRGA